MNAPTQRTNWAGPQGRACVAAGPNGEHRREPSEAARDKGQEGGVALPDDRPGAAEDGFGATVSFPELLTRLASRQTRAWRLAGECCRTAAVAARSAPIERRRQGGKEKLLVLVQ